MHHFHYRDHVLHAEDVNLAKIAAEVGTPVYVYSEATIERHYQAFAGAFADCRARVFYAMKANSNLAVVRTLGRLGAGADTVSEGEVRKALAAGIPAGSIVFSGVGKSEAELAYAVDAGIYQVNIETEGELYALDRMARARGRRQTAVFRINPDVGAGGHAKITTGAKDNKFGISYEDAGRLYEAAARLGSVTVAGLAVHIGSQIREPQDFAPAFSRLRELAVELRRQGHTVERLDLGGGLGIPYDMEEAVGHGPDLIHAYADLVKAQFRPLDVELGFEPGRLIVGNAGILLTRAVQLNVRQSRTFLVVDAAMNDLVRPAMYEAYHDVWPVTEPEAGCRPETYDIVGPICETGDTFARDRSLAPTQPGDLIAFMTAGAYGASMSSTYNSRPLVPEVLVNGARWAVVRPRQTWDDLIGQDRVPEWLR